MSARFLDGEGVWTSDKIREVKKEFRSEYPSWLPLADANGVFEANPGLIWRKVYSYNRPEISVEKVAEILDEFERVGLVVTWKKSSQGRKDSKKYEKRYAYFVGIESRLPPKTHRKRYKTLGVKPPASLWRESTTTPDKIHPELELELEIEPEKELEQEPDVEGKVRLEKELEKISLTILGIDTFVPDFAKEKLKLYAEVYGKLEVIEAFQNWAESRRGEQIQYPASEFLKVASGLLQGIITGRSNPEVDDLAITLHGMESSAPAATSKELAVLGAFLKEGYTAEEIRAAYLAHLGTLDDYGVKKAIKTFCDGAGRLLLLSNRRAAVKEAEVRAEIEQARVRAQEEVAKEAASGNRTGEEEAEMEAAREFLERQ